MWKFPWRLTNFSISKYVYSVKPQLHRKWGLKNNANLINFGRHYDCLILFNY